LRKWIEGILLLSVIPIFFVVLVVSVVVLMFASGNATVPGGNVSPLPHIVGWFFSGLVLLAFTGACALAWRASPADRRGGPGGVIVVCLLVALIPLAGWGVGLSTKAWVVEAFKVPTGSMESTIMPGDRLLVWKTAFRPERGDIIVFRNPMDRSQNYVKRVIATEGETVELKDGAIYVDGKKVTSGFVGRIRYAPARTSTSTDSVVPEKYAGPDNPFEIPPGHVFVLGDNVERSYDSREFGPIPVTDVIGKAYKRFWPLSQAGPLE
jgi:signal peptidase I